MHLRVIKRNRTESVVVMAEAVLAFGESFNARQTVTAGIISELGRHKFGLNDCTGFTLTDAVNQKNRAAHSSSGAPHQQHKLLAPGCLNRNRLCRLNASCRSGAPKPFEGRLEHGHIVIVPCCSSSSSALPLSVA